MPIAAAKSNWIDRAIGYISPKWGMERQAWRQAQASYKGGVPTRMSEGWTQFPQPFTLQANAERWTLGSARDRAYQAYENNPVAETLVNVETNNVIGDGLNYQPSSDSEEWNREAKDKYYEWLEVCSVRGPDIHSGCDVQRHLYGQSRVAGDILWILVNRDYVDRATGSLTVNSKIQIVPAENIVTPDGESGDPSWYHGVKVDASGAPTAFSVLSVDAFTARRSFQTVAARDCVYFPHLRKTNQVRGVTCFSTIFDLLSHLDRYVDGVSLAAWMATVFGLVFKENTAAKQFQNLGLVTNSQGNQQRAVTFENGQVKYMAPEGEIVQVDAKQPMAHTDAMIRQYFRMLGQPFDMPLEMVAMDMSTCNFASARIGLLPFYRSCRIKAARFAMRWGRTIRWWLSREAQRGPDDPKRWKSKWPDRYWGSGHDLVVNAWPYTDPVSEAQADKLMVDCGFKSPQMVINERGYDGEQIWTDRVEWQDRTETEDLPDVRGTLTRDPTPESQKVVAVDANGNPVSGVAQPLNGAQITAAIDVLTKSREGALSDEAATELLVQIGVPPDRAEAIVKSLSKLTTGTGDVSFKREVLKQLLTVPAAREAVFNGTDIEDLIEQTGLSPEEGYQAPYIPVVAATGPLVSGDTIQDPQGDIVGGDVEAGSTVPDTAVGAASPTGIPPAKQPEK